GDGENRLRASADLGEAFHFHGPADPALRAADHEGDGRTAAQDGQPPLDTRSGRIPSITFKVTKGGRDRAWRCSTSAITFSPDWHSILQFVQLKTSSIVNNPAKNP